MGASIPTRKMLVKYFWQDASQIFSNRDITTPNTNYREESSDFHRKEGNGAFKIVIL